MNLIEIISIIFIHWVADFVCQTEKMALGKSKNWTDLIKHTLTYTCIWYAFLWLIILVGCYFLNYNPQHFGWDCKILFFFPITFVAHTITDYYTSRINAILWEKKQIHDFFVSIGFDQFLHYIQLFLTYHFLTK